MIGLSGTERTCARMPSNPNQVMSHVFWWELLVHLIWLFIECCTLFHGLSQDTDPLNPFIAQTTFTSIIKLSSRTTADVHGFAMERAKKQEEGDVQRIS